MKYDADDAQFSEWVACAQQGDPAGFDSLVRALERPLAGFVRARGAADPEGLVNEVLVRVFSGIAGFDGNAPQFRAWVFRIARNLLVDERRRDGRRPHVVATAPDMLPEPIFSQPAFSEPTPDRLDESERVEAILAQVTSEQREVLLLRVVAELSVEETAEVLDCRPGAVRALQHRGLKRLRQEFARKP
ncbi:MAG: RNA polymerase sigma factor [Acidimicrobiales bacterium]|nr:RNA polymerase sigma factor [Acidimicrobiales bacterium]